MSDSKQNWAVAQKIDTQRRVVCIEMGIIDSFGDFHPDEDMCTEHQDPRWLTMTEADFKEAAKISMEAAKQHWASTFA